MDYQREEVATLRLNEDEDEEAVVIVTVLPNRRKIALCLSSIENGDTEIHLAPEDCEKVMNYLGQAIARL